MAAPEGSVEVVVVVDVVAEVVVPDPPVVEVVVVPPVPGVVVEVLPPVLVVWAPVPVVDAPVPVTLGPVQAARGSSVTRKGRRMRGRMRAALSWGRRATKQGSSGCCARDQGQVGRGRR